MKKGNWNFRLVLALLLLIPLAAYAANTKLRSAAITASTIDSTPIGATTPSTGAFSSIVDTGLLTGACMQVSAGQVLGYISIPCTYPLSGVIQASIGSNTAITANNPTTLLSIAATAPPTGCPCRIQASYSLYEVGTANQSITAVLENAAIPAWWGETQVYSAAGGTFGGQTWSGLSAQNYTNSTSVTVQLVVLSNQNFTVQYLPQNPIPPVGGIVPSGFQITFVPSS